jgi:anti-sigma-K factor RskA
MLPDDHVIDMIPGYALDCLNEEEKRQVTAHLSQCVHCREELEAYRRVVDELHQAVSPVEPPAGLKQQILSGVQPKQAAAGSDAPPLSLQRLWNGLHRAAPVWAYASFVLVIVLAASNLWLLQHVNRLDAAIPGEFRTISLAGFGKTPDATGLLVLSRDGNLGTLVVDGLPDLNAAQQYQLWLIKDGERTSGGVFSVSPAGYAALAIASNQPLKNFSAFGITIEPAGGSPAPTGEKVMGGSI